MLPWNKTWDVEMNSRIYEVAFSILDGFPIRETAKRLGLTRSTVHKDTQRLEYLDGNLYKAVKEQLEFNMSVAHIRGGQALKEKWETIRNEGR
ncbi:DNA binding protein [Bacillus phage YungSlug]|nr:DNA binding protein [Bacillus phage YungSlug]